MRPRIALGTLGARPRRTPNPSRAGAPRERPEDLLQAGLVSWARKHADRRLHWLYHVPNGGKRDPVTGAQLTRLGVRRGYPDLGLDVPAGRAHGLRLELKSATGTVSPHQRRWLTFLQAIGYATGVVRTMEQGQRALLDYLATGRLPDDVVWQPSAADRARIPTIWAPAIDRPAA